MDIFLKVWGALCIIGGTTNSNLNWPLIGLGIFLAIIGVVIGDWED